VVARRLSATVAACSLFVLSLCAASGCRGPRQPYTPLRAHAAELRSQFNRDVGRARIVILPAPN
jgi:hypothetical protein